MDVPPVDAATWRRFWALCDQDGPRSCWLWRLGAPRAAGGYALFFAGGRQWLAHRWLYTQAVGPIPAGLVLDHLCAVRHCVNPAHLEPVTLGENSRRGNEARRARRTGQLRLPLEWPP